jgi:TupA-like ATPgrasp
MLQTWQKAVLFFARMYFLVAHPILTFQFVWKLKSWPNPGAPQRYHEKLLWRKIVDHNPIFPDLSDKLAAKQIAQARCHELAVAQVLWTGTDPQLLPAKLVTGDVVIKANHCSGSNIFVADGKPAYAEIVRRASRLMAISYDRNYGEWGYRDVPRRIFIEKKLALGGGDLPTDIKVHAFDRGIAHVWVTDKLGGRSRTYDADGLPLSVRDSTYPSEQQTLPDSPATRALIRQALDLARRLLGGLDYARVDFMVADARLYFGEYTLYPGAGYDHWFDPELIQRAQSLWDLRSSDFLRKPRRGLPRLYAEALRAVIEQSEVAPAHG